jgi:hypothetical protein
MSDKKTAAGRLQPVGELLTLRYVPLAQVALWERNPKRHDLPGIMAAINRYGFQNPPKYDQALNNGAGGIAAGNGRVQALLAMQARGDQPPAGIAVDRTSGEWAAPIIFGNNLADQAAAEAFAIDHNNLVLAGGDFTSIYMTQMWDEEQYVTLLREMGADKLPETVDPLDLEIFNEVLFSDKAPRERVDKGAKIRLGMYIFYISREIYAAWETELRVKAGEEKEAIISELKRRLGVIEAEKQDEQQ